MISVVGAARRRRKQLTRSTLKEQTTMAKKKCRYGIAKKGRRKGQCLKNKRAKK